MLRAAYTPTADQPYSLESFFNRPLNDSDSSAWAPLPCDLLDHDQLKFLFCVLPSNLPGKVDVAFLHVCGPCRKGADADHPAKPAVVFPLVAVCMFRVDAGLETELFFQACVASLCSGEFVVVVVPIVKGWRPSGGVRSVRNMAVAMLAQYSPQVYSRRRAKIQSRCIVAEGTGRADRMSV